MFHSKDSANELNIQDLDDVVGGSSNRSSAKAIDPVGNLLSPQDFMDHQLEVFNEKKDGKTSPFYFVDEQRELWKLVDPDA